MNKLYPFIIAFLLASVPVLADQPFVGFSFPGIFSGGGSPVSRTMPARIGDVYNVKEFGAVGNGATCRGVCAEYTAIQNTINLACGPGANGGTIFFPPGTYQIGGNSIVFTACSNGRGITLKGAGVETWSQSGSTTIQCNLVGFCIDYAQPTANIANTLFGIEDLAVKNDVLDIGGGGIRFEYAGAGAHIKNCIVSAWVGIEAQLDTFGGPNIDNCWVSAPTQAPGTVGIYLGQNSLTNTRVTHFDIAIDHFGEGPYIHDFTMEVNNIGLLIGPRIPDTFVGYIQGTNLVVTKMIAGTYFTNIGPPSDIPGDHGLQAGKYIDTRLCLPCQPNTQITGGGPGDGGAGTYTITPSQNVASAAAPITMRTYSIGGSSTAGVVGGSTTERTNVPIEIDNGTSLSINGIALTGTVGPPTNAVSASYSPSCSAGSNCITYVLDRYIGRNGTYGCQAAGFDTGYNFQNYLPSASCVWSTVSGVTRVVITGAANPGGTGSSTALGAVSPQIDDCMYIGGGHDINITTLVCSTSSPVDINMNDFVGGRVSFHNVNIANGIRTAVNNQHRNIKVYDSVGMNEASFAKVYIGLPGTAGTGVNAEEGETYLMTDGRIDSCSDSGTSTPCSIGAYVTGGGGALHFLLYYNGSHWTIIGK